MIKQREREQVDTESAFAFGSTLPVPDRASTEISNIFGRFAKLDAPHQSPTFDDIKAANATMNINEFSAFAAEYQLVPQVVNSAKLREVFNMANLGGTAVSDRLSLSLPEFTTAVKLLAAIGFPEDESSVIALLEGQHIVGAPRMPSRDGPRGSPSAGSGHRHSRAQSETERLAERMDSIEETKLWPENRSNQMQRILNLQLQKLEVEFNAACDREDAMELSLQPSPKKVSPMKTGVRLYQHSIESQRYRELANMQETGGQSPAMEQLKLDLLLAQSRGEHSLLNSPSVGTPEADKLQEMIYGPPKEKSVMAIEREKQKLEKADEEHRMLKTLRREIKAAAYTDGGVDLWKFFSRLDKNGDGMLQRSEFIHAARHHLRTHDEGRPLPDEQLQTFFDVIDLDGDGEIDVVEFATFVEGGTHYQDEEVTTSAQAIKALKDHEGQDCDEVESVEPCAEEGGARGEEDVVAEPDKTEFTDVEDFISDMIVDHFLADL